MSEARQLANKALHELTVTEAAHAAYRQECLDGAVKLAAMGLKDEAYTKLLMVVAIDGVRAKVLMKTDDAVIEDSLQKALAQANTPKD